MQACMHTRARTRTHAHTRGRLRTGLVLVSKARRYHTSKTGGAQLNQENRGGGLQQESSPIQQMQEGVKGPRRERLQACGCIRHLQSDRSLPLYLPQYASISLSTSSLHFNSPVKNQRLKLNESDKAGRGQRPYVKPWLQGPQPFHHREVRCLAGPHLQAPLLLLKRARLRPTTDVAHSVCTPQLSASLRLLTCLTTDAIRFKTTLQSVCCK